MDRHAIAAALQQAHIDQYGWAVTAVLPVEAGDGPPFAYTVGLTATGQPEFVIAGLGHTISGPLLNDIAHRVYHNHHEYRHGDIVTDLIDGYDAILIDGPPTETLWPGTAIRRYGRDQVRLRQIVWPDIHGRFPWGPGYHLPADIQPLLGTL